MVDDLEQQSLASFAKSWEEFVASVTDRMDKAGAEVMPAGAVKPISGEGGTKPGSAAAARGHTVA